MEKTNKWLLLFGIILLISLVSGGTAAILVTGFIYDIIYAVHKVSSVITAILFIYSIRFYKKN